MHPWFPVHENVRVNLSQNRARPPTHSRVASKKFDRIGLKNDGEFLQHVDRRRMLLAFQHADVVPIDARTVRKLLLRQVFDLTQPA